MAALVRAMPSSPGACSPTGELYGPHGQIAGDIFWRIAERARRARGQEHQAATAAAPAPAPAEPAAPPRPPPHTPDTGVARWEPPSLRRSATAPAADGRARGRSTFPSSDSLDTLATIESILLESGGPLRRVQSESAVIASKRVRFSPRRQVIEVPREASREAP